ncbi:MAG: J domain-containing protein [Amphiplicatus sp.]
MSEYAYKPRLGFDIRVRPPAAGDEPPAWTHAATRLCEAPDCSHRAAVRVAKNPREMQAKLWLCVQHAHEHNRRWNFFEGLSEPEAEAARLATLYGDRPTWSMGRNDRARAAHPRGFGDLQDAFGLFADAPRRPPMQAKMRNGRVLPKLQAQAFETLGLRATAAGPDIRRRYAELLRRYHPDANGGDRSAESQLAAVVKAHQILKKAGIC